MSELDSSFIKEEKLSNAEGVVSLNLRLFRSLPLFLKFLPLSIVTILLSSAAPSVFRWYSGNFSNSSPALAFPSWGINLKFTLLGLGIVTLLATLLRISAWAFFETSGMWSSQTIHQAMVRAMTLTRTTFFDENPSGRLINRLVRDFDEVRSTAIIFMGDFFNANVEILSIGVVASLASPWAALMVVPLLTIFSYIQFQRSAMLDHSRSFAAISTSHVLGRKNDLIEGREIFLIYGKGEQLLQRMAHSFRKYIQASALAVQIETWASFWIRIFAECFSFIVLILLTMAISKNQIDPALAGVIISSLFGITGSIGWLDFATSLISRSTPHVRRVFEFVDLPTEEKEEGTPSMTAQRRSRETDSLVFENYTMSYRKDTPVILEGLDLEIPLGSKTALIGRTGSGKTSIIQSLLRMVYVRQGNIRIGNQSIFEIDLKEHRQKFGVVPQAPYLFAGTLRSNLDRLGTLSTKSLEDAMASVGLDYPLNYKITEGGQNLSQGERQLACLARVIAADRKIILMDEPTSGLDPETDAWVNRIFATTFKNRTVLTIIHRTESLGSYDWIVEMKAGKVANKTHPLQS